MDRRKFLKSAGLTGTVAAATALATPAIAKSGKTISVVSTWPRDFPGVGTSAQRLAKRIKDISGGELNVKYFAAGEMVGGFDVFDTVASGNANAYVSAEYFWKGKSPAFGYFTTVPFGMTAPEMTSWIQFGGGQALWDEISAEFGLKALLCGSSGTQMGGWFNKEILTKTDLKGLKMRIPGYGGEVLSKLGVATVSLPPSQIYENLVSGAIDATEWIGPFNDYFMKFYEAAKFYYHPGFHEPGGVASFGMNKKWWDGLSASHKAIITSACNEEHGLQYAEAQANNGKFLKRLVEENGVKLRNFSDEIYEAFGKATLEVFEDVRKKDKVTAKVDEAYWKFLREIAKWQKISENSFSIQRNRVLGI